MTTSTNLGRVAIVPKGTWNSATAYTKLNVVSYGGSSYMAIQNVPIGTPVNDTDYWQIVAEKGQTGGLGQVAEIFDATKNYAVGDYCIYNDDLYRFTTAHSAGAWNSSHVALISITDEFKTKANTSDVASALADMEDEIDTKQNALTFDTVPTASSTNPVESGGVKTALDAKQDTLTFDSTPTASSTNPVESGGVKTALDTLDDAKVSKSGDTMTGNLVIKGATNVVGLEINPPEDSDRGAEFRFSKATETERVYVYHFKNNNTNYDLFKFPATTHGETSNGTYELLSTKNVVTTEQGGTGGTDSGWLSLPANSTVYTGTIHYRRIGMWVQVNLYQIRLVSELTSSSGITLNELPSGYRPAHIVSLSAGNTSSGMGLLWISTSGNLQFFKPAGVSSYPNTQNIYCTGMFFV